MRVLVTGHEGYLGTVLCEVIGQAGHEVTGLDVGLFADCVLGAPPTPPPALRIDVRDVLATDLAGFDAVIHLAALSNDPLGELEPDITYAVNQQATLRLAIAARDAGVRRFIYASTCSVYGAASADELVGEDSPLAPVTHYAISKVRAESALHELADADFEPVYLRNATAFGYSARPRGDIVANFLAASAYLTGVVRVLSDGTPWRPLVHIRDIAGAFLAALEAPRQDVHDTAINVGSAAANLQVAQIAQVVAAAAGAIVEITNELGPDPRSYRVDFTRLAERLPSFRPLWTVERGVSDLLSAYRRHGLTTAAFERYQRLPVLRALREAGRLDADLRWTAQGQPESRHDQIPG